MRTPAAIDNSLGNRALDATEDCSPSETKSDCTLLESESETSDGTLAPSRESPSIKAFVRACAVPPDGIPAPSREFPAESAAATS